MHTCDNVCQTWSNLHGWTCKHMSAIFESSQPEDLYGGDSLNLHRCVIPHVKTWSFYLDSDPSTQTWHWLIWNTQSLKESQKDFLTIHKLYSVSSVYFACPHHKAVKVEGYVHSSLFACDWAVTEPVTKPSSKAKHQFYDDTMFLWKLKV